MTIGEFLANAALSILIVWSWWIFSASVLIVTGGVMQRVAIMRQEQREEIERAVERVKAECQAKRDAAHERISREVLTDESARAAAKTFRNLGRAAAAVSGLPDCDCAFCRAKRDETLRSLQAEVNRPQDAPKTINCRCLPLRSETHELGHRRKQLVERLALYVGEDEPVFCSWPAGRPEIRIPTRGGDPLVLRRTDECVLDDSTGRLAVIYRPKPE